MTALKIFLWLVNAPLRILFWPILWWNMRRRRLRILRKGAHAIKEDEWSILDRYLVSVGHVVKTFGYFPWEEKARICWPCVVSWINFFLLLYIFRDFLNGLL